MKDGDVALTLLPQADGNLKYRPVVVLCRMPPFGDLLVCGISTQLQDEVDGFDDTINPSDSDFKRTGLKAPSLIRLGFLAALPPNRFAGSTRAISAKRHKLLLRRLTEFFKAQSEL